MEREKKFFKTNHHVSNSAPFVVSGIVVVLLLFVSLLIIVPNTYASPTGREKSHLPSAESLEEPAFTTETSSAGFYKFDVNLPETFNLISSYEDIVWAGEFSKDTITPTLYIINDNTTNLEAINTTTGVSTIIGPTENDNTTGMARDPVDGTIYVSDTPSCGTGSNLYTINLSTGALTLVGDISNSSCVMAIAFDASGQLFGFDIIKDSLISIDKSDGTGTVIGIGSTGFDANFFGHGMDLEPATHTMYLASYNDTNSQTELRTVDLATGNTTLVGILGSDTPGGQVHVGWLAFEGFSSGKGFNVFLPTILDND